MKKDLKISVGLFLLGLLFPLVSLAAFHEDLKEDREGVRKDIQQKREALRQSVQEKREALKQEVKEKSEALKGEFKEKRGVIKQGLEERNQAVRGDAKAAREELKKKQEVFHEEVKTKREAVKAELEARREKFKEEAQARKEELKKKLGEKRAENIEKFFNQAVAKLEAAIKRLKDLSDKIASRLSKAEDNGRDISELRTKLSFANDKIAAAEKSLEEAKARYAEAVKDPDFKASFQKVREAVNTIKEAVKEAHRALVDVVNSIKVLRGDADNGAPSNQQ